MAKTARDSFKFMLRLPDEMRDALRAAAEESGRSVTAEILSRLEWTFEADKSAKGERVVFQTPEGLLADDVQKAMEDINKRALQIAFAEAMQRFGATRVVADDDEDSAK